MAKTIKKLEEELANLAASLRDPGPQTEALLVGAAYEGQPTQEKALVFVFSGHEYLVPFLNMWDGNQVVESVVYLDRVEQVVSRPRATSRISEMIRSRRISLEARAAITKGVQAWFLPERGYTVAIVPFADPAAPVCD